MFLFQLNGFLKKIVRPTEQNSEVSAHTVQDEFLQHVLPIFECLSLIK